MCARPTAKGPARRAIDTTGQEGWAFGRRGSFSIFDGDDSILQMQLRTQEAIRFDRQVLALTCRFIKLHVHEFRSFETEHSSFLLYSDGTDFDWWPARLRKDGYLLEPVASDEKENVYWVKRNRDLHGDPASSQQGSQ